MVFNLIGLLRVYFGLCFCGLFCVCAFLVLGFACVLKKERKERGTELGGSGAGDDLGGVGEKKKHDQKILYKILFLIK